MIRLLFVVVLTAAGAVPDFAQTCAISAGGLAFGTFNPIDNRTQDTVATIGVTCTGIAGQRVSLRIGASTDRAGIAGRFMMLAGQQIRYNLYVDAGRQLIWGDGTGGSVPITDSFALRSTAETRVYTIYGRIAGAQARVPAGPAPHTYSDNLTLTVITQ